MGRWETSSRPSRDDTNLLQPRASEGKEALPPENYQLSDGESHDYVNEGLAMAPREWREQWLKENTALAIKAWKAEKAGDIRKAQEIRRELRD